MKLADVKIAVVGLGYVGFPLAVEFGKLYPVVGFDISVTRCNELIMGVDSTLEISPAEMQQAMGLKVTSRPDDIKDSNCFIVTVPTPIDEQMRPNLEPLGNAARTVGSVLKQGDLVIFESTVYPGATEEFCVPILEKHSNLHFNADFFCGYSPERINPGDKQHRLTDIVKVTSGSTPETADFVDQLYNQVITAGTFRAESIKVAEAAKVIENTQRDVNIALMNELAIIFERLGLDTEAVLKAAGSKWNFFPFRPGLVGGHCIGVDPYYLTHKAQAVGYHPEIILAGRRLNDGMGKYVASRLLKEMSRRSVSIQASRILVMGFTFKENCPDIRNTRIVDLVKELSEYSSTVDVFDPWASFEEVAFTYDIELIDEPKNGSYDGVVLAVAHDVFREMGIDHVKRFLKTNGVVFDIKSLFEANEDTFRL